MEKVSVRELYKDAKKFVNQEIKISGWVKTPSLSDYP